MLAEYTLCKTATPAQRQRIATAFTSKGVIVANVTKASSECYDQFFEATRILCQHEAKGKHMQNYTHTHAKTNKQIATESNHTDKKQTMTHTHRHSHASYMILEHHKAVSWRVMVTTVSGGFPHVAMSQRAII